MIDKLKTPLARLDPSLVPNSTIIKFLEEMKDLCSVEKREEKGPGL